MAPSPADPVLIDTGSALAATGLVHRAQHPAGSGPFPTVVLLHGRGGDEDVMWIFARALPPGTLVVAPRAPMPDRAIGGYTWVERTDDDWPDVARFEAAAVAVEQFFSALPGLYGADPARLGLMGFSQGAATAFVVAARAPRQMQAVASLVGFMPEGALTGRGRPWAGLPVLMVAGRQDTLVPLERARASAEVLRMGGAELTFHDYDVGHKLNAAGLRDLAAWWPGRLG